MQLSFHLNQAVHGRGAHPGELIDKVVVALVDGSALVLGQLDPALCKGVAVFVCVLDDVFDTE